MERGASRMTRATARHAGRPASPARRRIVYAPVTFSEEAGVRFLHFGTEWVQGAMRLARPDAIELEYARQLMAFTLFLASPRHLVQLGLGAASVTRFCHRAYPDASVIAVELNPAVVVAARTMFGLPHDEPGLSVIEADADAFVNDPANERVFDAMQVDLYDARARGPVLESPDFYAACRACLRAPGVLTVNLFGAHASFGRNMRSLREAFEGRVIALPEVHEGNRVALAFHGPSIDVPWTAMRKRAAVVARTMKLDAPSWVDGLHAVASGARRGTGATRFRI